MTRPQLIGTVHTEDSKVLCVFVDNDSVELVLATGKLVALDKYGTGQLTSLLTKAYAVAHAHTDQSASRRIEANHAQPVVSDEPAGEPTTRKAT